ncbi:MAG: hypothetical protein ACPID2_01690 [Candidatus Puniceispirillum sp.]
MSYKNLTRLFLLPLCTILIGCDEAPTDKDVSTKTVEIDDQKIDVSGDVFKSLINLIEQASSTETCQKSADIIFEKMSSSKLNSNYEVNKNKFEVNFVISEQVNKMELKSSYKLARHGSNCMSSISRDSK